MITATGESGDDGRNVPLDPVAEKLAALGVPAIVLIVVMAFTGYAGGAAIITALATLGGPLGMLGGLAVLGILVLISNALARWGIDVLLKAVLEKMKEKGQTKQQILNNVEGYWFLSRSRKDQIRRYVEALYPENG